MKLSDKTSILASQIRFVLMILEILTPLSANKLSSVKKTYKYTL